MRRSSFRAASFMASSARCPTGTAHGEYSGRAIWNTLTQPPQWDRRVDRQREADGVTISFRAPDGALEVKNAALTFAKHAAINLTGISADTADFGDTVTGTFAAVFTSILKKIRGLSASSSGAVQKTGDETIAGVKTFTTVPVVPAALSLSELVSDTRPATEAQLKHALDT